MPTQTVELFLYLATFSKFRGLDTEIRKGLLLMNIMSTYKDCSDCMFCLKGSDYTIVLGICTVIT